MNLEAIENSHSEDTSYPNELNENQKSYLSELFLTEQEWSLLSVDKQEELLSAISERMDEFGDNVSKETLQSELPDYMKDSFISFEQVERRQGLTLEERQDIRERTGWTNKIVDFIQSKEEAEIYINAHLKEGIVNGKAALLNPLIHGDDYNCRDTWFGLEHPDYKEWSNADLMGEGFPPHDSNGDSFELHHIGQNPNSPLAELTYNQHHSDGNFKILHTNFSETSINRNSFESEKSEYWQSRYKDFSC